MRAVVFEDIGSVRVVDVPEPSLEDPHDAMVRVTVGAVCGSDLHAYHGTLPMDPGERLGHEAAGVVEQVGAAVRRRVVHRVEVTLGVQHLTRLLRGSTGVEVDQLVTAAHGAAAASLPGSTVPARNETDQMIQAQREFVADASHELRTPLTSILANLELLQARLDAV